MAMRGVTTNSNCTFMPGGSIPTPIYVHEVDGVSEYGTQVLNVVS